VSWGNGIQDQGLKWDENREWHVVW